MTYERTDGGKWKIGQCSELNQKPQKIRTSREGSFLSLIMTSEKKVKAWLTHITRWPVYHAADIEVRHQILLIEDPMILRLIKIVNK